MLAYRTGWQYQGIRAFTESAARHAAEILLLVRGLRAKFLENARSFDERDVVHLDMDYARDPAQPTLTIKTFQRPAPAAGAGSGAPRVLGTLRRKKAGDALTAVDIIPAAPARRPAESFRSSMTTCLRKRSRWESRRFRRSSSRGILRVLRPAGGQPDSRASRAAVHLRPDPLPSCKLVPARGITMGCFG